MASYIPQTPTDYGLQLSRGLLTGLRSNHKFGYNPAVNTTEQPVWAESAVSYSYPSAAATVTVSSDSANDTSAGTGARTVYIEGLDSTWAEVSETVTMNGTTAVTSSNSHIRLNRMYVVTAGNGNINAGIVYAGTGVVTAGKPAVVLASIIAARGQTLQAIYSVPLGYTAYVVSMHASADGGGEIRLYRRDFGGAFRIQANENIAAGGHLDIDHQEYQAYPAKTDIEVRAIAATGSIKTSAEFEMILVAT